MRYHTKRGVVDEKVSFYKGVASKQGGGGGTQLESCLCLDNICWGALSVQDEVPYCHGLLLGQMFYYNLRENSNNKAALYYSSIYLHFGNLKFQRFFSFKSNKQYNLSAGFNTL